MNGGGQKTIKWHLQSVRKKNETANLAFFTKWKYLSEVKVKYIFKQTQAEEIFH